MKHRSKAALAARVGRTLAVILDLMVIAVIVAVVRDKQVAKAPSAKQVEEVPA